MNTFLKMANFSKPSVLACLVLFVFLDNSFLVSGHRGIYYSPYEPMSSGRSIPYRNIYFKPKESDFSFPPPPPPPTYQSNPRFPPQNPRGFYSGPPPSSSKEYGNNGKNSIDNFPKEPFFGGKERPAFPIKPIDDPQEEVKNVEMVTIVLRHGHRTPDSLYPKYPNQKETFYPHGFGELTNEGKRREFSIGRSLRKRYLNFMGPIVEPDTLIARSSAILRAKRSLLLVLAGLYPPVGEQVWDPTINWQAIPTSYLPLQNDNIFFGGWCPRVVELTKIYNQTEDYKRTYNKFVPTFDYITEKTGMPVRDYQAVMRLFFDFKGQQDLGVPLPEWTKNVFPKPMEDISIEMYKSLTANDEMMKYSGGFLMKQILDEMLMKAEGKLPKGRKLYVYSGHEINIAFLMRLLGVYFDHAPPFGAYLTFELHNNKGVYGVKVLYQDYTGPKMKVMVVPGCEAVCPYFKLLEILQKRLPGPQDTCERITLNLAHIKLE